MMKPRCPHADIQHCPLYIAAHTAKGIGCDDGKWEPGAGCAISRGKNYRAEVERVRMIEPGLVERAEWNESAEKAKAQRARNLRLNGIH
jgi:hypothetical protein